MGSAIICRKHKKAVIATTWKENGHTFQLPYAIESKGFTLDIITKDEYHEAALFAAAIFSQEEPISISLKMTQSEIYSIAMDTLQSPNSPNISVRIRNQSSEIIGVLICEQVEIGNCQKVIDPDKFPKSIYQLMCLIQKSRVFYDDYYQRNQLSGKVVEMFIGAVSRKYRGDNLGTYLTCGASLAALLKGYSRAIGEATNVFSYNVAIRNGFKILNSIDYASFTVGDQKVFETVDEEFTRFVNQQNPSKKFTRTASHCHLIEATLQELLQTTLKNLNI
jgi:hypothetical protein